MMPLASRVTRMAFSMSPSGVTRLHLSPTVGEEIVCLLKSIF